MLVAAGRRAMLRTGQEKDWKTPFEVESSKLGPRYAFRGGKVDDICVTVGVASEAAPVAAKL